MPMYVVRSYLPYSTLINFELVDNKLERNTIIEAKSAMTLNDIQHVDLPGTMKDVYSLTIKLKSVNNYTINSIKIIILILYKKIVIILAKSLRRPPHQYP